MAPSMTARLARLFPLVLVGCSSSSEPTTSIPDAASETPACDQACRTQTLTATFGATTEPFERAVYGVTSPAKSVSKTWELHVEAMHGGFAGCPVETSPTPKRALVIAGLPVPFATPRSYDQGARASLLDYSSTLTTEPILRATKVLATPRATDVCTDCATHDAGFVAFDLEAMFDGGTLRGHVYAIHCDSMDDR